MEPMVVRRTGPIAALVAALLVLPGLAQAQARLDDAERGAIEDVVREYLLAHPEVLVEALGKYEEKQRLATEQRQREALTAKRSELRDDPMSPVLGNPDGDVVVVEFFDYRCPYCKTVAKPLMDTVRADGNVRLVMKEFPILGPDSLFAARAALAAAKQDRYEAFHMALMELKGQADEASVMRVAESLGLDLERLRQDMGSSEIDEAIRNNYRLADVLNIGGTPAFVIGDALVPGALDAERLRQMIAQQRAGSG